MKTKIERTFKNVEEHYAEIRRMLEEVNLKVLGITAEYDDTIDPSTAFVITLQGKANRLSQSVISQVLTNYVYRIEWTR